MVLDIKASFDAWWSLAEPPPRGEHARRLWCESAVLPPRGALACRAGTSGSRAGGPSSSRGARDLGSHAVVVPVPNYGDDDSGFEVDSDSDVGDPNPVPAPLDASRDAEHHRRWAAGEAVDVDSD